jgi:methyl coenzyme M reductase gamma subunit
LELKPNSTSVNSSDNSISLALNETTEINDETKRKKLEEFRQEEELAKRVLSGEIDEEVKVGKTTSNTTIATPTTAQQEEVGGSVGDELFKKTEEEASKHDETTTITMVKYGGGLRHKTEVKYQ